MRPSASLQLLISLQGGLAQYVSRKMQRSPDGHLKPAQEAAPS